MKKYFRILAMTFFLTVTVLPPQKAQAIPLAVIIEVIKAGVKKAIKALDLKIQRLQNKTIWLQNAQKVLENTMSKLKLKEIANWTEKQRELYDQYFQELWKVKAALHAYQKVKDIIQMQGQIVDEYGRAWNLLKEDENFTKAELEYMYGVYSNILEESLKNLDQLFLVINSFKTQMSDGARLELIHDAGKRVEENLTDLRRFNHRNFSLSISRGRSQQEVELLKELYGLP